MHPTAYFDGHCDTISYCEQEGLHLLKNSAHLDLHRAAAYARFAQIFAIYYDSALYPAGTRWARTCRLYDWFARELAGCEHTVRFCRSRTEVNAAHEAGLGAALVSVEGAELLECSAAHLHEAADRGIVAVNLTHNHTNAVGTCNLDPSPFGLTQLGADFVRQAQLRDVLIDVSHCSERTFWDTVRITQKPIVASHSNAKALQPHSRNLTDDQFRAICDCGGMVGINLYTPFLGGGEDLDALVAHIEHFWQLGGEKTVCLGTDFDGCESICKPLRGIEDMPLVYRALKARGYDDALLEDLFFRNWMRVLRSE